MKRSEHTHADAVEEAFGCQDGRVALGYPAQAASPAEKSRWGEQGVPADRMGTRLAFILAGK